jgi:hypothetical protein
LKNHESTNPDKIEATMKIKRVAEHQINKDEYEAQDDRDIEAPDPGTGMSRASEDVMKKRKIVKAR